MYTPPPPPPPPPGTRESVRGTPRLGFPAENSSSVGNHLAKGRLLLQSWGRCLVRWWLKLQHYACPMQNKHSAHAKGSCA